MASVKIEHDDRYGQNVPFLANHTHWSETPGYHPHHHPSAPDYGVVYNYADGASGYGGHSISRPSHQQLQPLVVPQWPSMLANQTSYSAYPQSASGTLHQSPATAQTPHPTSAPPQIRPSAAAKPHAANPRKTLTEANRREMCKYHVENPTAKQTEIGSIFGVERSTVSKVLRQKDRYLDSNDINRSPIKKSRGKLPDIDRALVNWIKNQQSHGYKLTDDKIREQAKIFSTATHGSAEEHANIESAWWLKDFKRRNNIAGTRSRKSSFRSLKSPRPTSPPVKQEEGLSPILQSGLNTPGTEISFASGSPRATHYQIGNNYSLYHSQSNTSLSSAFGAEETPPAGFSAADTPSDSPFFHHASLHLDGQHSTTLYSSMPIAPTAMQRSRSQTFTLVPGTGAGEYISPPATSHTATPTFISPALGMSSPATSNMPPPSTFPSRHDQQTSQQSYSSPTTRARYYDPLSSGKSPRIHADNQTISKAHSSPQPTSTRSLLATSSIPAPSDIFPTQRIQEQRAARNNNRSTRHQPSQEEARAALEIVSDFFEYQSEDASATNTAVGGVVGREPQEYFTIGKLIEKLKIRLQPLHSSTSNYHPTSSFAHMKVENIIGAEVLL